MCYFGGMLTVTSYLFFLFIAWFLFPNPASPLDHWLSDFGRYQVPADGGPVWRVVNGDYKSYLELGIPSIMNPGALFYNLACILSGISMFFFFTGFLAYLNKEDKIHKLLTYTLMIIGYLGGIFLILIGIFSEDGIFLVLIDKDVSYPVHHTSTIIFFALLVGIKILSGLWVWKHDMNRLVAIYAWVVIIFDIIVVVTNNIFAWIEWTSVLLSLATVGIVALGLFFKDKPSAFKE
jgi:hypothetical membrane protein